MIWPQGKPQGPNTAPPINRKLDWRFSEHGSAHQNKTQPVLPIRKLLKASYPYPPEGRQNENHHHRKLTNLITWITALSNSKKLWAMPCRATKTDGTWWWVLAKPGPLEKGMANHFSVLALRTPWTVWKGKKDMTLKNEFPRCPVCYWRSVEK